eukprot:TRINITY_DN14151_c0_g1_i4.p1 TRINITY_DN14151_c0_g1~~TRINITY_DN14151_c0_g1_i4.p1  ORF type:complete len:290 (+),score=49.00 TRINITY_DN14151_c0_g1_i4:26-895(+)
MSEEEKGFLAGATRAVTMSLIRGAAKIFSNPTKLFRPKRIKIQQFLLIANMSSHHHTPPNFYQSFKLLGASNLARIILPPLLVNSLFGSIVFTLYGHLVSSKKLKMRGEPSERAHRKVPLHYHYVSGFVAGLLVSPLATPIENIKYFIEEKPYNEILQKKGVLHTTTMVVRAHGWDLFKGLPLTIVGESLSYAAFFGLWVTFKSLLKGWSRLGGVGVEGDPPKAKIWLGETFRVLVAGSCAGVGFNVMSHPIDNIRRELMREQLDLDPTKSKDVFLSYFDTSTWGAWVL